MASGCGFTAVDVTWGDVSEAASPLDYQGLDGGSCSSTDRERPTDNHDVDVDFLFTHLDEIWGFVECGRFEVFCVVRVLELGTATTISKECVEIALQ